MLLWERYIKLQIFYKIFFEIWNQFLFGMLLCRGYILPVFFVSFFTLLFQLWILSNCYEQWSAITAPNFGLWNRSTFCFILYLSCFFLCFFYYVLFSKIFQNFLKHFTLKLYFHFFLECCFAIDIKACKFSTKCSLKYEIYFFLEWCFASARPCLNSQSFQLFQLWNLRNCLNSCWW
jgi:hypothetical protein